jgi:hypothetical protein
MSTTHEDQVVHSATLTCQLILATLIAGMVMMLGISTALGPMIREEPPTDVPPRPGPPAAAGLAPPRADGSMGLGEILAWTSAGFAALVLPLSFVVSGRVVKRQRRDIAAGTWKPPANADTSGWAKDPAALQSDTGKLVFVYQMQLIIGAVIIESAAFFAASAYLLGREPIALGAAVLLIGILMYWFPTHSRVASWIDRQQQLLIEERHAAV